MAGYCGGAIALGELVSAPEHSLVLQSYKPREMLSGVVNADGYGAAMWLNDGVPKPAVYRTVAPIWADPNQAWMNERLSVRSAIAAVRSATPGIGYEVTNVQPFSFGNVAFAHNGFLTDFRRGFQRALRHTLGRVAYESIQGSSDSEHLFALIVDRLGDEGLAGAVRAALRKLDDLCVELERTAVATIVVSDGEELVGCRWSRGLPPATLYVAQFKAGWALASEPLTADGFRALEPRQMVTLRAGRDPKVEELS